MTKKKAKAEESEFTILEVNDMKIKWIDYRKWKPLQGELKEITKTNLEKLLKSFETKKGFVPAFVWEASDKTFYIMDAHQRQKMFLEKNVKFKRPDSDKLTYQYPCVMITADSFEDAQEKLLAIVSNYGEITQSGFDSFVKGLNQDWILDTTPFGSFMSKDDDNDNNSGKGDQSGKLGKTYQIVVSCESEDDQEQTFEHLSEMGYDCDVLTI